MFKSLLNSVVCLGMCCTLAQAADPAFAFEQLQKLAGNWQLVVRDTEAKAAFRISYRTISRATALVETFGNPSTGVTETIYHRDGSSLMATHYCAQGNQPRLLLAPDSTAATLHLKFLDVTNLAHPTDSHLVDLKFTFKADGRLQREETYRQNGAEDRSTLLLERITP